MTEQERLGHHADLWMRDRDFTPVYTPDLPPVTTERPANGMNWSAPAWNR